MYSGCQPRHRGSAASCQPTHQARPPLLQVEQLRGAVVQLLEARRQGKLQEAALQELKGSYAAGQGVTDFESALSGRVAELAAAQP